MRVKIVLLVVLALVAAPFQAVAESHVVSAAEVQQALVQAAAQRQADQAAVASVLASPEAREVASAMGVDAGRVTEGLSTLSDSEVRELAQRAQALSTDPVAGMDINRNTLLTVLIAVAIVYLVLQILD
jgi:hypothetical protein